MRMISQHPPKRAAGFTLVELLLALTLMSMLLALAYGGLRASTRATDRGQTILEDSSRIRMAHQFVRKQLNQLTPLAFGENEDQSERYVFEGEAKRIRYVAPMPGYLGFGGPQVQELSLVSGKEGLDLVLNHALLQGFEETNLYVRAPIVLMEDIEFGEFSFLGLDENGDLTSWTNFWEDPTVLPKSVSLEIEFSDDVYINWPELTAAVRVDPESLESVSGGRNTQRSYSESIRDLVNKREKQ